MNGWLHVFIKFTESISCPGSYPCKPVSLGEPGRCVVIEAVCDGIVDCALGDDEQQCGKHNVTLVK